MFYRRNKVWVVYFYKPDSTKVQKTAEEIKTLEQKFIGIINVAVVDWEEDEEICLELGAYESPTIRIFGEKYNDEGVPFKGKMEWKEISNAATARMESFVSVVTDNNYNEFMNREKNNMKVLLFSKKKKASILYKALSKFSKQFSYGFVKESDPLTKKFGIETLPSIWVVENYYSHKADCYTGELQFESLKAFLREYMIGEKKVDAFTQTQLVKLDENSYRSGVWGPKESKFWFIYFSEEGSDSEKNKEIIAEKVREFSKSPIIFVYVDIKESSEFYGTFGTDSQIIMYRPKKKKFAEFKKGEINAKNLFLFIDGVMGSSEKYVKLDSHPTFEVHTEDL